MVRLILTLFVFFLHIKAEAQECSFSESDNSQIESITIDGRMMVEKYMVCLLPILLILVRK